ncbi:MAG: 30S ribosomal protein S6 [Geminicoccaceae bacterium]|nr:30S ribosomal protein S6 [Geminicoccaceae bacterium]MCS7267119.1 30S ribosomal protein S6 [Geminicoccaceae bacterium]MCX7630019.1 30S ribosomal protein S6 [Geminicoccaceae bacterium]MDW8124989.1 30S ribosomal protein S6 [Geminicoccaceae bacterium]MDW8341709.1 30S ribosomal protein S6 [Geminicoccaceae bacterium]
MPFYEHTLIARPDLTAQQAQTLGETLAQLIAEHGGKVTKTEYWGLRNLAYRIKKNRKGHYLHFNIDAPAAAIAELERTERINEDVLRYLTVRVDKLDPGPSPIMLAKASRDERAKRERELRGEARPEREGTTETV